MDRVLHIVSRIFTYMFVNDGSNNYFIKRMVLFVVNSPYLVLGVSLMIVGFSVGLLRRLIHS